eukprot:g10797.t1 g10797   contig4:2585982-2587817(+)
MRGITTCDHRRQWLSPLLCILHTTLLLQPSAGFVCAIIFRGIRSSDTNTPWKLNLHDDDGGHHHPPSACLEGYIPPDQRDELEQLLINAGYNSIVASETSEGSVFRYKYQKATGMLRLIDHDSLNKQTPKTSTFGEPPRYIPVQKEEEKLLVSNGWSFLDPDESEPLSAYDIDAANKEGQYVPKWGSTDGDAETTDNKLHLSSVGYDLQKLSSDQVMESINNNYVSEQAKKVLLEGGTDPPHVKLTNNGYDFSTNHLQSLHFPHVGVFSCAVGLMPLFTTADLSQSISTASSGWLSFKSVISQDHIVLVHPTLNDLDQRIEVLDAKSGCHLGHYFGRVDGYCINASALNFTPLELEIEEEHNVISPVSWRGWSDAPIDDFSPVMMTPSHAILRQMLLSIIRQEFILLGAGCFWHTEFALRRLPGVIDTQTGYAGGDFKSYPNPDYKVVCSGTSGHAEVVKVVFDPTVCDARKLIDCWLAMHDPTMVRSHGKRAVGIGQYRSCAFVFNDSMREVTNNAIMECQRHLEKELCSEVKVLSEDDFWFAEDRHQRHDEKRKMKGYADGNNNQELSTLTFDDWLCNYGRRSTSVWGSSETAEVAGASEDDGMARMMI